MKFERLDESEYEAFAAAWPLASFLQSSAMAHRRERDGWMPHFVGVRAADGTLKGVAHLSVRPVLMGYTDVECQQGPLMDFDEQEVAVFFLREIKQYARQLRALTVRINPDIPANHRGADTALLDDGYDAGPYYRLFADAGYTHLDNQRIDNEAELLRWYFRKDLTGITSSDQLMDGFAQQTRWSVRKALKSGVRVRQIDASELDTFYDLMVRTAERRSFKARSRSYFESLLEVFDRDHAQLLVAELPLDEYMTNLKAQQSEAEADAKQHDPDSPEKKERTAHRVAREAADHYAKKLRDAEALAGEGDVLLLAGAVFILYGGEMSYVLSAADTRYREFCGPYALQWHAMNTALGRGLAAYNFYGTKGEFSGHPDQQGIYEFKRGFGGYVEEQIGFFEAVPHPMMNMARNMLRTIRG